MRIFREYKEQDLKEAKMDFTTTLYLTTLPQEQRNIGVVAAQTTLITVADTRKGDNGMRNTHTATIKLSKWLTFNRTRRVGGRSSRFLC